MCRTARIPSPVCGTCLFLFCRQINPSIHIGYGVQRRGGALGTAQTIIGQISAELWQEALLASGLVAPTWLGQLVILDADAVTAWDLRGLFERMAQTAYLHGSTQHMVQRCELVELLLLAPVPPNDRHTPAMLLRKRTSLVSMILS